MKKHIKKHIFKWLITFNKDSTNNISRKRFSQEKALSCVRTFFFKQFFVCLEEGICGQNTGLQPIICTIFLKCSIMK